MCVMQICGANLWQFLGPFCQEHCSFSQQSLPEIAISMGSCEFMAEICCDDVHSGVKRQRIMRRICSIHGKNANKQHSLSFPVSAGLLLEQVESSPSRMWLSGRTLLQIRNRGKQMWPWSFWCHDRLGSPFTPWGWQRKPYIADDVADLLLHWTLVSVNLSVICLFPLVFNEQIQNYHKP